MKPDFRVNMNFEEWREYEKREKEKERSKRQYEAEREFGLFAVKFLIPLFLIGLGYVEIFIGRISNGVLLIILGIIYLSLTVYYFLLRDYLKKRKYHNKRR